MAVGAAARGQAVRRPALAWAAAALALAAWRAPAFAAGPVGGLGLAARRAPAAAAAELPTALSAAKKKAAAKKAPAKKAPAKKAAAKKAPAKKAAAKKAPAKKAPAKKAAAKKAPAKKVVAKKAPAKKAVAKKVVAKKVPAKKAPANKALKASVLGDVAKITVAALAAACAGAGLVKTGSKAVLLQRYLGALPKSEIKAACKASLVPVTGSRDGLTASLEREMMTGAFRKAMPPNKVKLLVVQGKMPETGGGLKKKDFVKNKYGKIVSKKAQKHAKGNPWMKAVVAARKALGVKGFAVVGGKTKQGKALYTKAKSLMK